MIKETDSTQSTDCHVLFNAESPEPNCPLNMRALTQCKLQLVKQRACNEALSAQLRKAQGELSAQQEENARILVTTQSLQQHIETLLRNETSLRTAKSQLEKQREELLFRVEAAEAEAKFLAAEHSLEEAMTCEETVSTLHFDLEQLKQPLFTTETSVSADIPASQSRKSPSEEYFNLVLPMQTCLVIKLNSPYRDALCTVSIKDLYEAALQDKIPFHYWHSWIERELNNRYLKSLYTSKLSAIKHLIPDCS